MSNMLWLQWIFGSYRPIPNAVLSMSEIMSDEAVKHLLEMCFYTVEEN